MAYTNSSLVCYTKISPNRTSPRNHKIDTIAIHCMAANLTIEKCGEVFASTTKKASSNYGIGTDGRIALYCPESDRSWCTSSASVDNRAITIEVANDGGSPDWHVSNKALASLIKLVADICRRNNIKELKWKADKSLIGQIDKQNMVVHRWTANKSCPGNYLYNKHYYIAEEVNKLLGINPAPAVTYKPNTVLSCTASIKGVQEYLNKYYGIYIEKVIGSKLSVDGNFGTKSQKALAIAFQTEMNTIGATLTIDGSFGISSEQAFNKFVGSIKTGSKGIFVTLWQCLLIGFKCSVGSIDGSYGTKTKNATNELFKIKGLPQDYIVDGKDINKLL